jgi:hypothetical protein
MVFLPSFTNACIALAMYNGTLTLALLLRPTTSLWNYCHVIVHLWILPQVDSVACLMDTCQVKDPDRALVPQFHTVHELHPT